MRSTTETSGGLIVFEIVLEILCQSTSAMTVLENYLDLFLLAGIRTYEGDRNGYGCPEDAGRH